MALRTGTLYREYGWRRFKRGIGLVQRVRWCAEITVDGVRYRCKSGSEAAAQAWLDDMVERFPEYVGGRGRRTEDGSHERDGRGTGKRTRRAGKWPKGVATKAETSAKPKVARKVRGEFLLSLMRTRKVFGFDERGAVVGSREDDIATDLGWGITRVRALAAWLRREKFLTMRAIADGTRILTVKD